MSKINTFYRLIGLQHGDCKKSLQYLSPHPPFSLNISITINTTAKTDITFPDDLYWANFAKEAHWIQTQKWQNVNLWKRVILKVQRLWKRDLPEQEAVLWAIHPSTAPTKEFPDEIHISASAKDQSQGNSKIISIIYYFSISTSLSLKPI